MVDTVLVTSLLVVVFFIGVLCGVLWYRYQQRNHPEKLKRWISDAEEAFLQLQEQANTATEAQLAEIRSKKNKMVEELSRLLARLK